MPSIYAFPPLYTRQPNTLVRKQQIDTWIDILTEWCKSHRVFELGKDGVPVRESDASDADDGADGGTTTGNEAGRSLFKNEEINRAVPPLFIDEIWSVMATRGVALVTEGRASYYVLWRTLDSWASLILQWFETVGKLNQVVTLYELTESDETADWEFHSMPLPLLHRCLKPLCNRNRATLMKDEHGTPVALKVV
ncbi:ESCRT-II complex subunit [Nakaseomyces glabratus]